MRETSVSLLPVVSGSATNLVLSVVELTLNDGIGKG